MAVAIYLHSVRSSAYMIYLYRAKDDGGMTDETTALLTQTFYAVRFQAKAR
jgi:hypothetical protein